VTANIHRPARPFRALALTLRFAGSDFSPQRPRKLRSSRIGLVATFGGNRAPTDRYHVEPITIQFHATLLAATVPPKEYLFEQEIVKRLGRLSFQDPETVAEGLSLI
jgi:hypothetical protein